MFKDKDGCRCLAGCPVHTETAEPSGNMRTFQTGATRNSDANKLDFEGFLSPRVLRCYAEYMNRHRRLPHGGLRDSDNWQRGIPRDAYVKSLWRHFFDVWSLHRGTTAVDAGNFEEALCGVLFNAMGLLHETTKEGEKCGK